MSHPNTWRPQQLLSQTIQPGSLHGPSGFERLASSTQNHHTPVARSRWGPTIAPLRQDFILLPAFQPVQDALRRGHTWPDPRPGSQPVPKPIADDAYATSKQPNLSRLPFFRSQVLKQEIDAVKTSKQSSKSKSTIVKTECTPETETTAYLQTIPAYCDGTAVPSSSSFPQDAHFPGARKRPFHLVEQGLPSQPRQVVRVHVQSQRQSRATEAEIPYNGSDKLPFRLPRLVAPASPEHVQSALALMQPMIVYAQYACDAGCRSRGICVHFSFLLGGRQVPDGLICAACKAAHMERSYAAPRICPRHNKRTLSQFTPNLPEDYLPSKAQLQRASDIFKRTWNGNWNGVPAKVSKWVDIVAACHVEDVTGIDAFDGETERCDAVMPSIEVNDNSEEHVRKKRRVSAEVEAKNPRHSRDIENATRQSSGVTNGSCSSFNPQADAGHGEGGDMRTPRASTIVGDHAEADTTTDAEFW